MKRVIVLFCLLLSQLSVADVIGVINVQQIVKGYQDAVEVRATLKEKETIFREEFAEAQQKLKKAKDGGSTEDQLQSMLDEIKKELEPKKDALLAENEKETGRIRGSIEKAVKTVASKLGVDVVMESQAIVMGGMDLTTMVLEELNNEN